MRQVLLTGHAGFIGRHTREALEEVGCLVVGADPRDQGSLVAFSDLLDGKLTVDTVIHLGAITDTLCEDDEKLIAVNFRLPQELWQWCTKNDATFVFASSAAVYGRGERGFDEEELILHPLNKYGRSKLAFDRWAYARALADEAPPRWAGLRFFNVYGPGEQPKGRMASMVSQAIWAEEQGVELRLFKHGEQMRDFVYVKDVVKVILWAMSSMAVQYSGFFNVGSGVASQFRTMASSVGVNVRWIEMPQDTRRRFQNYTRADIRRLRKAGFKEEFATLPKGLALYRNDAA